MHNSIHRIEYIVFIFSFVKIDFVKGCIEKGIMCYGKRWAKTLLPELFKFFLSLFSNFPRTSNFKSVLQ